MPSTAATGTSEGYGVLGVCDRDQCAAPFTSFRFTGCCWWRPLAVDGRAGDISGTRLGTPVMRRPDTRRRGVISQPVSGAVPVSRRLKSGDLDGAAPGAGALG